MKTLPGTSNVKQQRGAALLVVLSVIAVSLMLGVTSMHSSMVDERMAGNFKAAAQAQMNAEHAASAMLTALASAPRDKISRSVVTNYDWGDGGLRWSSFNELLGSKDVASESCLSTGDSLACYMELPERAFGSGLLEGDYIVAMGSLMQGVGGEEETVISESNPVFVRVSGAFLGFFPEATVSCLGSECDFMPGQGNSGPAIDGTDRKMDGKTTGSNRPEPILDGDGNKVMVPAVIMADRNSTATGSSTGGGVLGDEIYTKDQYNEFKESLGFSGYDISEDGWVAIKKVIRQEIKEAVGKAPGSSEVFYAGPGQTVSPGSASGVVVIDGGTLVFGGDDRFSGLVIMNGGQIQSTGTPAIVGAVIGEDFSFEGTGNPTILYSSEAVESVNGRSAKCLI
ncbi:pilus assembly PilX family protein [Halomonas icarae]|uniref:pilus assembly PilX family protein n=1 Tax=Halomonas icarae TaxID=2691040 RepID=UPI001372BF24|nr:hypothetical protein [Halomonas icarae]MDR5903579.1 hypothetical protein [Halomonas icarae]